MITKICIMLVIDITFLFSCADSDATKEIYPADDSEIMGDRNENEIDSMAFDKLVGLTDTAIAYNKLNDSLAFLIIPLDAVCPHCRDKAIKALLAHKEGLSEDHYVIITASSYKGIRAFFTERKQSTPEEKGSIFLDGESEAFKNNLIFMHPTVYYAHNKEVYKKVVSYPTNIDKTLEDFFQ